jgi:hypothetical protein
MNTINHDMADDVADWAIKNMADLRTAEIDTRSDRARKQWEETEAWHLPHMTRLVNACTGNCDQGDKCNCAPCPAECGTEIGADDGKPARPGLSWAEFKKTLREPLAMFAGVVVVCIVLVAMRIMGSQQ